MRISTVSDQPDPHAALRFEVTVDEVTLEPSIRLSGWKSITAQLVNDAKALEAMEFMKQACHTLYTLGVIGLHERKVEAEHG